MKMKKQEDQINEFLLQGIKTYKELMNEKRPVLATQILATTSKLADLLLTISRVRENNHKVFCHCGKQLTNGVEIEFYNKIGECSKCDHLRSDR